MLTQKNEPEKFYYPRCKERNCYGVLLIKKINDDFSLNFECEKNKEHKGKNIYFKTFVRYYLEEKNISQCTKCTLSQAEGKCKICKNNYCSSCSVKDEHIKQDTKNFLMDSQKNKLNKYCIDCNLYFDDENEHDEEHQIISLIDKIPSEKDINEIKNRLKYYDKLLIAIDDWNETFNKKIKNLKQKIIDEKTFLEKMMVNFDKNFLNYTYCINFEELFNNYTKSFSNDYLEDFYISDSFENKTKALLDYFSKQKYNLKIEEDKYSCFKNILEGKLLKLNDNYCLNYSNNNVLQLIKYDEKNGNFEIIKDSKINYEKNIKSVSCQKYSDTLYKIYICLSSEKKIEIFECDLSKNIIYITKDEIIDDEESFISYNFKKCIDLNKNGYIASIKSDHIIIWIKKESEGYLKIKMINSNSDINDILSVNDDYFIILNKSDEIIFYNKNTFSEEYTINIEYVKNIKSVLLFNEKYIILLCNKGIGIISVNTKELVQYIEKNENCIMDICSGNDAIYALYKINNDEGGEEKEKEKEKENDDKLIIFKYKMISNELKQVGKIIPYSVENEEKYNDFSLIYFNQKKLLITCDSNYIYEVNISPIYNYTLEFRKSHITKSGKCVLKKYLD